MVSNQDRDPADLNVLVVGGGIGGLAVALALRRAGVAVHVYEQAAVLREVGAGLALGPNAVNVLHRLGLADALRAVGVVPLSMDPRDGHTGARIARIPLAELAVQRWGAPFYHLHRSDLHNALRAALGEQHLTLGARCVAVEQDGAEIRIRFADGREASGAVLIGADGIHSTVREYVAGPDRPQWSRQISWRGLAPAAVGHAVDLEVRHHSFWGPRQQFVAFYVSGGRLVNWVGNTQSDDDWQEESWSARGDRAQVLQLYSGWHPQVQGLIAGTEQVFKWALFDQPPLQKWSRGRVTLLGDAAHPMLPYLAQGASQSIEDAFVLASCLAHDPVGPEHALRQYADLRRQRTAAIQAASQEQAQLVQLSDPAAIATRNARLAVTPDAYAARWEWIYGFDAASGVVPLSDSEPARHS